MDMSTTMSMPSSTSASTATATMDMSSSSSTSMTMTMDMTFFTSTTTPLYSTAWTPTSTATYAATCVFLICLAISFRCLLAFKAHAEAQWAAKARRRRYVVVVDDAGEDTPPYRDADAKADKATAVLTARGVDERVRVVEAGTVGVGVQGTPWRLSVDLPRAALYVVIVGVGYLEMLAVMTMNVGYFASVLGGAFLGELFVGRYAAHLDTHH